jgi:hypothetical protein
MIADISINKPILLDFFKYLFKEEEGAFLISSTKDIGKYLISRVSYSDIPVKKIPGSIRIKLPKTANTTGQNKYLYYTKEDVEKINFELDATFSIDFDRYYLQGLKLNLKQKEILSSYILSRNLISAEGDIETLKKRKYREEMKNLQKMTRFLKNRSYQRHHIIEDSLKYHITI